MTKARPAFALVLLLALQSLCALPGLEQQTPVPEDDRVGTINLVNSQVQSGHPENLQYLEGIQDFYNGSSVRVTEGGKGRLDLNDGTQMTLFNETEVSGVNVSTSPPETDLFLQNQGFLGYVPPGGRTIVNMPNGAKITILGTSFFIMFNNETRVATAGNFDGSVLYTPPGGPEEDLSPGMMVNIPPESGGEVVLLEIPFMPEQFEAAVDSAGTPTAGLNALLEEFQIKPLSGAVFTGQEVARMTHDNLVTSVAFSPDGRYVASGGRDSIARVWEASTGVETARMVHRGADAHVAFSPDGRYVVSAGDFMAHVWEVFTGQQVTSITHESGVSAVAFSPDGIHAASSGSSDHTILVWEAFTGNGVARMIHDSWIFSVAFSPDGRYVAAAGCDVFDPDNFCLQGSAFVWEAFSGKEVARMTHDGLVISIAFSPDGRYVASASSDGTARVWEVFSGKEVARMRHGLPAQFSGSAPSSVDFSPDGRYVVSTVGDTTARVWEAATGAEVASFTQNGGVYAVAFSPDGQFVVSGGCDEFSEGICKQGAMRVWEVFTGREIAYMPHDNYVTTVAFSPDGRHALSVSYETIRVWTWQPN